MSALASIHVAKKQLGLDEDTYRSLLQRVTGKTSAGAMSEGERGRVLDEMRRHGFKPAKKAVEGPFAAKLQALWIAAWNLGIVRDRTDAALLEFVSRQTSISHTRFLIDAEDAAKVVDALKAWMAREAGVDWSVTVTTTAWMKLPGAKIAVAQWNVLVRKEVLTGMEAATGFRKFVAEHAKAVDRMTDKDWPTVMNLLGERVRKAVA